MRNVRCFTPWASLAPWFADLISLDSMVKQKHSSFEQFMTGLASGTPFPVTSASQ